MTLRFKENETKARIINENFSKMIKENVDNVENGEGNSCFICSVGNDTYSCHHEMNLREFGPKYFLLYNNICEYAIFDNKYLKILKIVPEENKNLSTL